MSIFLLLSRGCRTILCVQAVLGGGARCVSFRQYERATECALFASFRPILFPAVAADLSCPLITRIRRTARAATSSIRDFGAFAAVALDASSTSHLLSVASSC